MIERVSRNDWYKPPEGILKVTDFEIAQGFIDRERADQAYLAVHPLSDNTEHIARHAAARPEMEALMSEYEQRLDNGDEELASLLALRVTREVQELKRGERSGVTGQAHLLSDHI